MPPGATVEASSPRLLIEKARSGITDGAVGGDVGGSVVQEVASLEANGGRTSDQRMMVNGVALSSMIAGGWGGGAVPNATGPRSSPSTSRAWTRRPRRAACESTSFRATAAIGSAARSRQLRDRGLRQRQLHRHDVQQRGLAVPGTIKANGDFNPGVGGPIERDKLWFFLSGDRYLRTTTSPSMFFNANANKVDRFDYVPSTDQAILHQEQTIYQARLTWQATPKHKFGVTFDQENFCACTTGIGPASGAYPPEAGNDRRFPLQRFVTVDWSTPVSNRLLIEASGIHRVERWGGMEPQVGKLGQHRPPRRPA